MTGHRQPAMTASRLQRFCRTFSTLLWKGDDPGMRMVAEVIASAFASGFSWGGDALGKRAYCAPPDLKGHQIMSAFEAFVRDNPALAERPYGEAMTGTLRKAFPCGQGT